MIYLCVSGSSCISTGFLKVLSDLNERLRFSSVHGSCVQWGEEGLKRSITGIKDVSWELCQTTPSEIEPRRIFALGENLNLN